MKKFELEIKKGESVNQDQIAMIEHYLMNNCIQYEGTEDEQDPEDFTFLTAKRNLRITITGWRK